MLPWPRRLLLVGALSSCLTACGASKDPVGVRRFDRTGTSCRDAASPILPEGGMPAGQMGDSLVATPLGPTSVDSVSLLDPIRECPEGRDECIVGVSAGAAQALVWSSSGEVFRTGYGLETSPARWPLPSTKPLLAISGVAPKCAVFADATVACWENVDEFFPVVDHAWRPIEDVAYAWAGFYDSTCFVTQAGTLLCDRDGVHVPVENDAGEAITDVVQVAMGQWHKCLLRSDGEVLCWGRNDRNQLGMGPLNQPPSSDVPVPVQQGPREPLTGLRSISAGFLHTCGIRGDGEVWCWGSGQYGQIGFGGIDEPRLVDRPYAYRVVGTEHLRMVEVSSGTFSSCAREVNGEVYCWGSNGEGELGDGVDHSGGGSYYGNATGSAVRVAGIDDAVMISCGSRFACALTQQAEVACWGLNDTGQLGDGKQHETCFTDDCSRTPVRMLSPFAFDSNQ